MPHTARTLLTMTAALAATATLAAAPATATTPAATPARLTLPAPSGPDPVGVRQVHLVDRQRSDPWHPGRRRQLMLSVFYPAARRTAPAPQFSPAEAAAFDRFAGQANYGVAPGAVDWSATRLPAGADAPPRPAARARRVLLYSPGAGDQRTWAASLVTDLASRGYVVVAVDHTYEPSAVQFPGGRVARSVLPQQLGAAGRPATLRALLRKILATRVADTRSVLDALPRVTRALGPVDTAHVGMFGQSAGGFTAAQAMHDDAQLVSGADLDGVLSYVPDDGDPGHLSTAARDGVRHPFLLVGNPGDTPGTNPSWQAFAAHSRGRVSATTVPGTQHGSFTDAEWLLPQARRQHAVPAETVRADIGTAAPAPTLQRERTLLTGWFARTLPR